MRTLLALALLLSLAACGGGDPEQETCADSAASAPVPAEPGHVKLPPEPSACSSR